MKISQFSQPILWAIVAIMSFNSVMIVADPNRYRAPFIIVGIILIVVFLLFYKLVVTIDNSSVRLKFGIGLIKTSFSISSIVEIKAVRNSPLIGWGIRFHPDYTLYNASGLSAAEISFKDRSRKIRIGCSQPDELVTYLSRFI